MKGILKFDLENKDDEMAMKRAMKSNDMASFIFELEHNFWRKWKHDDSDFNLETYRHALKELLDAYEINIKELTY